MWMKMIDKLASLIELFFIESIQEGLQVSFLVFFSESFSSSSFGGPLLLLIVRDCVFF